MATRKSKTTIDHDEIRRWVEKNGGCPSHVTSTGRGKDPGVLRIDYPGGKGVDTLSQISWDEWFEAFEANGLAFVYSPSTRFSKLVARENAKPKKKTSAKKKTTAKKRTPTTTKKEKATAKKKKRASGGRRVQRAA